MVGCAAVNMAEHIDMCIKHGPGQRCGNMSDETKDIMPSVSSAFSVMSSQLKVVVGSINMAQGHTHCKLDEVHTYTDMTLIDTLLIKHMVHMLTKQPTEQLMDVLSKLPNDVLTEQPIEQPTDVLSEPPKDVLMEQPTEQPTDMLIELPMDVLTEQPMDMLPEQLMDMLMGSPWTC